MCQPFSTIVAFDNSLLKHHLIHCPIEASPQSLSINQQVDDYPTKHVNWIKIETNKRQIPLTTIV